MPPKLVVDQLPGQCEGIVAANPFLLPLKKFPASFSEEEKQRLTAAMTKAVNEEVLPAYKEFAAFLRDEYAPKGRTAISVESLPDGKRRYAEAVKAMTTVDIAPEAVHAAGPQGGGADHGGDDQAGAGAGLQGPRRLPRRDQQRSEVAAEERGPDRRRLQEVHRPDATAAAGALRAAAEGAGDGRGHSRLRQGRGDALRPRHSGRQTGRARGGRRRRPDPPHAGERRGRRLSRGRARAPHADQHGAAAPGPAEIPAVRRRRPVRLYRGLGAVLRKSWARRSASTRTRCPTTAG